VSAIAFADELIIVDRTLTLFKSDNYCNQEKAYSFNSYLVIWNSQYPSTFTGIYVIDPVYLLESIPPKMSSPPIVALSSLQKYN